MAKRACFHGRDAPDRADITRWLDHLAASSGDRRGSVALAMKSALPDGFVRSDGKDGVGHRRCSRRGSGESTAPTRLGPPLNATDPAGLRVYLTLGFQGFGGCSPASGAGPGNEIRGRTASDEAPTDVDELLEVRCVGVGSSRGITS